MDGTKEPHVRLVFQRLLHRLNDQEQLPPHPALCFPDGTLTYRDLGLHSRRWALYLLEKNFKATGSVLPICMSSHSKWTVVAMVAVIRAGAAFGFVDSSSPSAQRQLLSLASAVNTPCVVLGPEEYENLEMRSVAPDSVCIGAPTRLGKGEINAATRHVHGQEKDSAIPASGHAFGLAWATLESGSALVALHQHIAVLESISLLHSLQDEIHKVECGEKAHRPQGALILWPFVVRHDTLLALFMAIMQGDCILAPAESATLDDVALLLSRHAQRPSRTYTFPEKLSHWPLSRPTDCLGDIFLCSSNHSSRVPHAESRSRTLFSRDIGHGGVLVTSMLADGDERVVGGNCNIFVADPENMEQPRLAGAMGKLVMRDSGTLSRCVIPLGSPPTSWGPRTPSCTGGLLETGLWAHLQSDGSIRILCGASAAHPMPENKVVDIGHGQGTVHSHNTFPPRTDPMQCNSAATSENETPASNRMEVLMKLWVEVLCLDQSTIKPDDRFLDRGGDSLQATRLISLARAKGLELPVLELFTENLSLLEMAERMESRELQDAGDSPCGPDSSMDPQDAHSVQDSHQSCPPDGLLRRTLLSKWINPDHIEKVAPATGWQSEMIGHSTLDAQHWADCWVLDIYGPLSIDRLQASCASLLRTYEILRTVFAVFGGRAWQLVVGAAHYPLLFTIYEVETDRGETLETATQTMWHHTKRGRPELDGQWLRFMLLRQGTHRHRLLVRLTHAQYDAGSIPVVLQHLQASYQAHPMGPTELAPSPPFSSFVAWARRVRYVEAAQEFWRTMLHGSRPTQLLPEPRDGPAAAITGIEYVINERTRSPEIPLDLASLRGTTPAAVVSAAWAAVLMFLTGERDVVYGITTSGRHSAMDGVDRVVGPCWNVLPLRFEARAPETMVRELLQRVQRDQQAALAHELLPFRQIIEDCTDWPRWTGACSVLNFENVVVPRTGAARQCLAPDVELDFSPMAGPVSGPAAFWVAVTPREKRGVTLELRWDNRKFATDFMQATLHLFSRILVAFTSNPDMLLDEAIRGAASALEGPVAEALRHCIPRRLESTRAALEEIWVDVLYGTAPAEGFPRSVPYYAIRSDIIVAAGLAQSIRRRLGVEITTETIGRNPSFDMLESWLIRMTKIELGSK